MYLKLRQYVLEIIKDNYKFVEKVNIKTKI